MSWTVSTKINWWIDQMRADINAFLTSEVILIAAFFLTAFLLGKVVMLCGFHVNYARKLLGATMLAVPFAAAYYLPHATTPLTMAASFAISFLQLGLFAEPFRRRLAFLNTAFAAIDRPEDRPHTLTWFMTGFAASSIILMIMLWWAVPAFPAYGAIALTSVGIGDLLAGAVGTKFGRYKYATTALFTDKTYTRSIEGSACVFLTTLFAVIFFASGLPQGQFLAALITFPIVMTIAEAKSPHTWDEPVMFLSAMIVAMAIAKFWAMSVC